MNQEDAKREIIREWRALPKSSRQTDEHAALFAMQKFRGGSADPYQTIKGWLQRHLSLTRGLD
jgi:hypothetical protein